MINTNYEAVKDKANNRFRSIITISKIGRKLTDYLSEHHYFINDNIISIASSMFLDGYTENVQVTVSLFHRYNVPVYEEVAGDGTARYDRDAGGFKAREVSETEDC